MLLALNIKRCIMRFLLFLLISFVALTAVPSGFLMMLQSKGNPLGLPLEILNATPFKNFFFPGLILAIVGGVNLFGLFLLMDQNKRAYRFALLGGIVMTSWIIAQMILFQSYFWLQGIYLGVGISISLLSYQLMGKAAF